MTPNVQPVAYGPAGLVLRRLERLAPLDGEARAILSALNDIHSLPAGAELVGDRSPLRKPMFLLSGWAARVAPLPDGRRQIIGFVLPGDTVGIHFRPAPLVLAQMVALTPVKVVGAAPVAQALKSGKVRCISDVMHFAAAMHEAYLINQVVRLGRLTAYERTCHLLLEFHDRLELADIAEGGRFPLPLTQEVLADATGLSTVHVNRTLQQLRRDGLLKLHGGMAVLLDRARMAMLCDYAAPRPTQWRPERAEIQLSR